MKTHTELLMTGAKGVVECESKPGNLLTNDSAFKKLRNYHDQMASKLNLNELFSQDPERFKKFQ